MTVLIFRKDTYSSPVFSEDGDEAGYEDKTKWGFAGVPEDSSALETQPPGRYAVLPILEDEDGIKIGEAEYHSVKENTNSVRKVQGP